jgi:hypothetical protein
MSRAARSGRLDSGQRRRVVRDPKVGAYRARVLKRWAERQMSRARQRVKTDSPAGDIVESKQD